MDKSIQEGGGQGDDNCDYIISLFHSSDQLFQDSTIDFEKRRNVPVRYDRELIQTTVKAMKRVGEIKARRERAFFKHRSVFYPNVIPFSY